LDFWKEFHKPFYGFEHVELARNHTDEAHVGQHYALWMEEKGCKNWRDYFLPPTGNNSKQFRKWLIPEEYHYDAWIADRTNALLEEYHAKGENFFLWSSFFDPHPKYLVPVIVRLPGLIPEGKRSDALQSLVDLPTTFLSMSGINIPRDMVGLDQKDVWLGKSDKVRDHVIVENRHEPTTIHVKTYVDERYKITVYYNQSYGEIFDLKEDPKEINNLWNRSEYAELKRDLLMKLIFAEMGKEPLWMPRIAGA